MHESSHYLAIDLGASSGRGVLGSFNGTRLSIREIHRFKNRPVVRKTGLHWNSERLFANVKKCMAKVWDRGFNLSAIGIDTWGVDYGLLSQFGELLHRPWHYRDARTAGVMDEIGALIGRERVYARTGIAFLPFNTLYQLVADKRAGSLADAKALLFMPDLLNYWLTGIWRTEATIASTSQFFDPSQKTWASDLLVQLDLPADILPEITAPGTVVGPLLSRISRETGVRGALVIAPASHDTGSAVVAVPASGEADWAYISSGTWSLLGRELKAPICSPRALAANFTNECGLEDTIRFQKNVTGLWILQECQRVWALQGNAYSHQQVCELADAAPPLVSFIDPDDAVFAEFGDMPQRIRAYCERTRQAVPLSDGEIARCVLESLALKCRIVLDQLEGLTGPVRTMHMVGGGVNNRLLCQFTANAMGRSLIAGPVEATAIGNIMAQTLAMGRVTSLQQIRAVVAASFAPARYEPESSTQWDAARVRFGNLICS